MNLLPNISNRKNRGVAIVVIMIVLIVATGIGVWGLSSSRSSVLKAGSRKFSTELSYQAEQGLQKAVRRIQSIATGGADQVAVTNANTPSATGGNTSSKTITFLLGIPTESACSSATVNNPCTSFNALQNFDVQTGGGNVICNFLGAVDTNTQVTLVRKDDLNANGSLFAIYLVNSIATDSSGRKQAIQGVVVVPYAAGAATGTPYLTSSKAVTD